MKKAHNMDINLEDANESSVSKDKTTEFGMNHEQRISHHEKRFESRKKRCKGQSCTNSFNK